MVWKNWESIWSPNWHDRSWLFSIEEIQKWYEWTYEHVWVGDAEVLIDYRSARKGYAKETLCTIVEYGFGELGCGKISLHTHAMNPLFRNLMKATSCFWLRNGNKVMSQNTRCLILKWSSFYSKTTKVPYVAMAKGFCWYSIQTINHKVRLEWTTKTLRYIWKLRFHWRLNSYEISRIRT